MVKYVLIYTKGPLKHSNRQGAFFNRKMLISFLFLHENICCWYSLEAPRLGASNEYHKVCFHGEIRKILCGYLLLSVAMLRKTPKNKDQRRADEMMLMQCFCVFFFLLNFFIKAYLVGFCVEVMSSAVSLPKHRFTRQA